MNPKEANTAPAQPTEVKGTLIAPDDLSDWGNNVRLVEPGLKAEDGSEVKPAPTTEPEDDKGEPTAPKTDNTDPTPVAPEPATPTLVDPGEFQAPDASFEVTVFDEEGKNGKTVKVKSVEQWDELLDKDPNFGSATALLKAQRLATKMETRLDQAKSEHEAKVSKYQESKQATEKQEQAITTMTAEINYLVSKGELPPVPAQLQTADWSDPTVAKDPAVKAQTELLSYMQRENQARIKAGLSPMTSILDAWNGYQREQAKVAADASRTKVDQARKAAGAQVVGSTPNPVSVIPKGIMVGRGGNLRDLGGTDWST